MYSIDEEYEESDPGNELRKELENTPLLIDPNSLGRFRELLYTAQERNIDGFSEVGLEVEQIETVFKLFEIAKKPYSREEFAKFRM